MTHRYVLPPRNLECLGRLANKVTGKSPLARKMGPATMLTKEEEERICQWVYESAAAGFPITHEQLLFSIQNEKGIVLIPLFPNATHLLQPLDVAVFKPSKVAWRKRVHMWRIEKIQSEEGHALKKKDFAKLLKEVMEESLTPSILVNGFRKCGLVPWNPEAVTIPGKAIEKKDNTEKILFLKRGLHSLNESIPADTLIAFQSTIGDWSGDTTDKSLFNLWHSTKTEVEALQKEDSDLTHEDRTASPLAADFNIPAPISDLATADMELVHELPGPPSSTADFNIPAPISHLVTADMELVHELPGPPSSTADFNIPAPISDLATADMKLVHEQPGPSSTSTVPSPFKKHFFYVPTEVSKDTKRKPKEKLPTVAFGEDYVIYLKRKRRRISQSRS
ncbi:uncharacterized protein LOC114249992 [Bombyx mandarina]|uniref:Uncharacterized protein LOC114249992 n=1 Tax=Bombyx mandarina TaxID=7092 RepID=A0A6J2KH57_BOMMA|nr:uncharacterized protein LOC114249992 [Bombyx mandarina]